MEKEFVYGVRKVFFWFCGVFSGGVVDMDSVCCWFWEILGKFF